MWQTGLVLQLHSERAHTCGDCPCSPWLTWVLTKTAPRNTVPACECDRLFSAIFKGCLVKISKRNEATRKEKQALTEYFLYARHLWMHSFYLTWPWCVYYHLIFTAQGSEAQEAEEERGVLDIGAQDATPSHCWTHRNQPTWHQTLRLQKWFSKERDSDLGGSTQSWRKNYCTSTSK